MLSIFLLGLENGVQNPLDRKDALTRRPLDFDAEEETRKNETSKWLEHHFGSESRSSNSTLDDEEHPPKTSFFNVTIKSQPTRNESLQRSYVTTVNSPTPRVYSPVEPERDRNHSGYYKGNLKFPLYLFFSCASSFLHATAILFIISIIMFRLLSLW